ncbi:hypothetical protein MKZ38_009073 [Zalerion maritima]|uniref:Uncharacterized protein n=1 Tax=Zalerion maritima TaxID=339359 RepID=A0AAD5RKD3_9PEZI|nr:hypothetical protein MKZ38_009073 [Zalerion maritima]
MPQQPLGGGPKGKKIVFGDAAKVSDLSGQIKSPAGICFITLPKPQPMGNVPSSLSSLPVSEEKAWKIIAETFHLHESTFKPVDWPDAMAILATYFVNWNVTVAFERLSNMAQDWINDSYELSAMLENQQNNTENSNSDAPENLIGSGRDIDELLVEVRKSPYRLKVIEIPSQKTPDNVTTPAEERTDWVVQRVSQIIMELQRLSENLRVGREGISLHAELMRDQEARRHSKSGAASAWVATIFIPPSTVAVGALTKTPGGNGHLGARALTSSSQSFIAGEGAWNKSRSTVMRLSAEWNLESSAKLMQRADDTRALNVIYKLFKWLNSSTAASFEGAWSSGCRTHVAPRFRFSIDLFNWTFQKDLPSRSTREVAVMMHAIVSMQIVHQGLTVNVDVRFALFSAPELFSNSWAEMCKAVPATLWANNMSGSGAAGQSRKTLTATPLHTTPGY